ncbi:MAG: hypothetical protein KAS05_01140 [Candidatus Omnitrophica bacterium]|nr:hypothetical protein [Candidatus Omnitrophota bacterium]
MVNPARDNNKDITRRGKIPNEVNIRERVFLIAGADFSQHQRVVDNVKKRILRQKTSSFDSLTIYSKEANAKDLAEKLFTTSFEENKIVIFKNVQELSLVARKFLFTNLDKILSNNYLIFETDKDYYQFQKDKKLINDDFFVSVLKKATLFKVASIKRKVTIEDFIASLRRNNLSDSVYIVEKLFAGGSKDRILGPQIIGILVRKLSFLENPAKKDKYFKYLWEADRAIKEKGLDSRLVIESLLVKVLGSH